MVVWGCSLLNTLKTHIKTTAARTLHPLRAAGVTELFCRVRRRRTSFSLVVNPLGYCAGCLEYQGCDSLRSRLNARVVVCCVKLNAAQAGRTIGLVFLNGGGAGAHRNALLNCGFGAAILTAFIRKQDACQAVGGMAAGQLLGQTDRLHRIDSVFAGVHPLLTGRGLHRNNAPVMTQLIHFRLDG